MLNIKYQSFSLLYGYSLFWLMYSVLAPFHLLPDLSRLKCKYVVEQLPYSELFVKAVNSVHNNRFYKTILNLVFISSQATYMFVYLICNFLITSHDLSGFEAENSDSLTYKVLVNTPILVNSGILMITIINMLDSEDHIWKIYDDFDTTSIDYDTQFQLATRNMLATVPDILVNVLENCVILHFIINSDYYQNHFLIHLNPQAQIAWKYFMIVMLLLMGIMNVIIRYKPILIAVYSATCVSKHLQLINAQLLLKSSHETSASATANMAKRANDVDSSLNRATTETRSGSKVDEHLQRLATLAMNQLESKAQKSQREQSNTSPNEQVFAMNTLYELERHLTGLAHLIYDIDRVGPESILALTAINFTTYFYLAFHLKFDSGWLLSIVYAYACFARSLPISRMLRSGSSIEKECKKLVMILESRYLQNQTHSLIYKQMASSHLSLARILKILERVKLNCNGLMNIDSGTLKKCYLYLATIILILVQYDSVLYIS